MTRSDTISSLVVALEGMRTREEQHQTAANAYAMELHRNPRSSTVEHLHKAQHESAIAFERAQRRVQECYAVVADSYHWHPKTQSRVVMRHG